MALSDTKNWIRLNAEEILDKRTKIVYHLNHVDEYQVTVLNFSTGSIFTKALSVKRSNIENFDLKMESVELFYGTKD